MNSRDIFKGKSINDLMNMDINRMSIKELRSAVTRLNSAANKRVRTLRKQELNSPALRTLGNESKFSIKGLSSQAELRVAMYKVSDFLKNKTSTTRGYKDVRKKTMNSLKKAGVTGVTSDKLDKMFKVFDKLKEIDPSIEFLGTKYKILDNIVEIEEAQQDITADELLQIMIDKRDKIYEERQQYINNQFQNPFTVSFDEFFNRYDE